MLVSDVIARARALLRDKNDQSYRWPNSQLIGLVSDAQTELFQRRPEVNSAFDDVEEDVVVQPIAIVEHLDDELDAGERFASVLAYHVAASALMNDNGDIANLKRGQVYLQLYEKGVMTV